MIQFFLVFSDWGLLALRLVLGAIMVRHGWPKLKNFRGIKDEVAGLGFRPAVFWAGAVAFVEFVGGLALLGGFLTQIFAAFVFFQFLAIILRMRLRENFSRWEFDALISAVALALSFLGPGRFSLDYFWNLIVY